MIAAAIFVPALGCSLATAYAVGTEKLESPIERERDTNGPHALHVEPVFLELGFQPVRRAVAEFAIWPLAMLASPRPAPARDRPGRTIDRLLITIDQCLVVIDRDAEGSEETGRLTMRP